MTARTDEDLLRDYLAGDHAGFELLVRRHAQELFHFAMRFTGNSTAAEDVVQEAFLQVHTSAESFDPTRRFKPWLFTITANKARDLLRRRARKRELPFDAHVEADDEGGQRFIDLISSEQAAPDSDLLLEEKRRLVREVIAAIPERFSEVLILAYYHRFAYKEIGEILGIPLGTVKSRLHAAVARFSEAYRAVAEERSREER